jgi:hypothetical protein
MLLPPPLDGVTVDEPCVTSLQPSNLGGDAPSPVYNTLYWTPDVKIAMPPLAENPAVLSTVTATLDELVIVGGVPEM